MAPAPVAFAAEYRANMARNSLPAPPKSKMQWGFAIPGRKGGNLSDASKHPTRLFLAKGLWLLEATS